MGLLNDLTTSLQPVTNTLADTFNNGELIDVGEITRQTGLPLNGEDVAESDPTGVDVDLLSYRSADGHQSGLLELGVGPESSDSWTLTDIDVLSGSYGANALAALDIGPDITDEPVIYTTILMDPDKPFELEILGEPILDPLNDMGETDGLVPLAIVNNLLSGGLGGGLGGDLLGGGLTDGLLSGGLTGGLLSGGLTDGLLSGGMIPAGLGDVLPTDALPLGILDGLLGGDLI